MADHAHPVEHAPAAHGADHGAEHGGHPSVLGYLKVGGVLAVITIIEVAIYYVESLKDVLPWILIALSALKFGIVAAFFMHLKFDSRLFTAFFVGGLALAGSIIIAIMVLFGSFTQVPVVQPGGH